MEKLLGFEPASLLSCLVPETWGSQEGTLVKMRAPSGLDPHLPQLASNQTSSQVPRDIAAQRRGQACLLDTFPYYLT